MTGPQTPATQERSEEVRRFAQTLGFDACGFANVHAPIDPLGHLNLWLKAGYHADMTWLSRTAATRADVRRKLPGVRTVIVLARNYYSERPAGSAGRGRVARYAWGRDYHRVLRRPLIELARHIDSLEAGATSYASVDTGPVMERAWAQRAGVAALGKNSLGLRRDLGSWFFLATILTTVEFTPDKPAGDLCGTCTLCLEACPTQAIVQPGVVDARRCISYQTIENRSEVPPELHRGHGDWVFGCDVCQEVCPWNRFARETTAQAFHPRPEQANPALSDLLEMTEADFLIRFAGSPVRRAKFRGLRRNAHIAQTNSGGGRTQTE
jgi:epoxyqueuosine reductase